MRIVVASKRTDLPAVYGKWLLERLQAGSAVARHPATGAPREVDLTPEAMDALILWSKSYGAILPGLPALAARGYRLLFHFTVTGLGKPIEPCAPDLEEAARQARAIAGVFSPDHLLWRYDPILWGGSWDAAHHIRTFTRIARLLKDSVRRCCVGFADPDAMPHPAAAGLGVRHPTTAERRTLLGALTEAAARSGIALASCDPADAATGAVEWRSCADLALLARLYPNHRWPAAETDCPCAGAEVVDLGAYDTCTLGCTYCYATARPAARATRMRHRPQSLGLMGGLRPQGTRMPKHDPELAGRAEGVPCLHMGCLSR